MSFKNLLVRLQSCKSFGEWGVHFHYYSSQIHSADKVQSCQKDISTERKQIELLEIELSDQLIVRKQMIDF